MAQDREGDRGIVALVNLGDWPVFEIERKSFWGIMGRIYQFQVLYQS